MRSVPALTLAIAVWLAACSSDLGQGPGQASADDSWQTASLRDALTGEEFRIADLHGKVVVIEAMAVWCVNCRFQQVEARVALAELDSQDVVYISLDVDPNERENDLAAYARREGFTWRFVVASREVSRSLAARFGDQVLSPPATPMIVLGPAGDVVEQHVGIMGADQLVALVEEHLP